MMDRDDNRPSYIYHLIIHKVFKESGKRLLWTARKYPDVASPIRMINIAKRRRARYESECWIGHREYDLEFELWRTECNWVNISDTIEDEITMAVLGGNK